MSNRNEFAQLLNSVHIGEMDDLETVRKKLMLVGDWIQKHIPKKLYRYRSFDAKGYNIAALENDEIWGSSILTFNDPYECIPYYDKELTLSQFACGYSQDMIDTVKKLTLSDEIPAALYSLFPTSFWDNIKKQIEDGAQDMTLHSLFQTSKKVQEYIQNNWERIADRALLDMVRTEINRYVACFSERLDSYLMWSHYADSHKGFCIEYNFADAIAHCPFNCEKPQYCHGFSLNYPIQPVVYSDRRYNATSHVISVLMEEISQLNGTPMQHFPQLDTLLAAKCILNKSMEWQYEQEWRMVSPIMEIRDKYSKMMNMKPTAVYIGTNASHENEERLMNICEQKGIPCYKILHRYSEAFYSLGYTDAAFIKE